MWIEIFSYLPSDVDFLHVYVCVHTIVCMYARLVSAGSNTHTQLILRLSRI